jgi:hypothetical protein
MSSVILNEKVSSSCLTRLDDILLANKVFTDLSEFELNNDEESHHLMQLILDRILAKLSTSESSNIGSIKWSKSLIEKITSTIITPTLLPLIQSIKAQFDCIERQLTLNNELSSERFPNDFIYCLLCRHVYTCGNEDDKDQDKVKIKTDTTRIENTEQHNKENEKAKVLYRSKKINFF